MTCNDCNGKGIITEKASPPYEDEGPIIFTCPTCRGTGNKQKVDE